MPGLDCGNVVSEWLTDVLKKPCHLVYHSILPISRRSASDKLPLLKSDDTVSFHLLDFCTTSNLSKSINKKIASQ